MTPVLPGFAGHVPEALEGLYPNASFTKSAGWGNFNTTYSSVALLEATDPLFTTLGAQFNKLVLALYGDPSGQETPLLNADMYNEMGEVWRRWIDRGLAQHPPPALISPRADPSSGNATYLADCNAATYAAMTAANPNAIYVMQAWLFHSGFWSPDRVQAYLSGVPLGGMLILDLNTEDGPTWQQYDS